MNISRRHMLLGLAAASSAAATVTVEAAIHPSENPELIRLADELPAIAAVFQRENKSFKNKTKEWKSKTPWAPDELTVPGTAWPKVGDTQPGDPEKQILGVYLWRVGDDYPRRIVVKQWDVYYQLLQARRAKRRAKKDGNLGDFMAAEAEVDRLKVLHETAVRYEGHYRRIATEASAWYDRAFKAMDAAKEALERHISAMMDQEDFTVEGLLIKAQALAEWDRVGTGYFDRVAFRHGQDWHGKIAASILRHAQGGNS